MSDINAEQVHVVLKRAALKKVEVALIAAASFVNLLSQHMCLQQNGVELRSLLIALGPVISMTFVPPFIEYHQIS